jgi:predicted unusual protein kinase regulating ubiquinone biosynthesis (AarF/ABC1/UbiB family)
MSKATLHFGTPRIRRESQIEVEECLEHFDLRKGVCSENTEPRSRRIRLALRELGPVFIAFGQYLSTRNDLLPASDCLELSSLPDAAEPMSAEDVEDLIRKQLGHPSTEAFLYLDPQPISSGLVSQSHAALLPDGSSATVTLVRPDFQARFAHDLQLIPLLKPAFTCSEWSGLTLENEIASFARCVHGQSNFVQQADFVEALIVDAASFDRLRAPDLYRPFCASGILTMGRTLGSPLTDIFDRAESLDAPGRYSMSRQLWLVWLRQALFGRAFPVEPNPQSVSVFPSGQVGFDPRSCCRIAADSKKSLVEYLLAVVAENPDQACLALFQQVSPTRASDPEALRNSFRQATTFRRGEWQLGSRAQGLSYGLLLHWRLLHEHGYQLQDDLASFYRGMFLMSRCCEKFASQGDPLHDAAEELRVMAVFDRFRELPPLNNWKGDFSRYAALMMEAPRRLDQLLAVTADGKPVLHVTIDEPVSQKRRPDLATLVTVLCVILAALAVLDPAAFRRLTNALGTDRTMMLALWLALILALRRVL